MVRMSDVLGKAFQQPERCQRYPHNQVDNEALRFTYEVTINNISRLIAFLGLHEGSKRNIFGSFIFKPEYHETTSNQNHRTGLGRRFEHRIPRDSLSRTIRFS